MTRLFGLISILFLTIANVGCGPPIRIKPGLSAVRIRIDARPKTGYREPSSATYRVSDAPPNVGDFERVNYRSLDDIVVWIEPMASAWQRPTPPEVVVSIGEPQTARLHVSSRGGILRVRAGDEPETIYSVSAGNQFDFGRLDANEQVTWQIAGAGVIEVWSAQRDEPVAVVYVAPTPWVRRASGGETVIFTDLPPGMCRISCWHERLPGSSRMIELVADEAVSARLTVEVNSLPPPP